MTTYETRRTSYCIYNIQHCARSGGSPAGFWTGCFLFSLFITFFFLLDLLYGSIGFGVRAFASGVGYRGHRCKAWFPVFSAEHSGIHSSWSWRRGFSEDTANLTLLDSFFLIFLFLFPFVWVLLGRYGVLHQKEKKFHDPLIPKPFGKTKKKKIEWAMMTSCLRDETGGLVVDFLCHCVSLQISFVFHFVSVLKVFFVSSLVSVIPRINTSALWANLSRLHRLPICPWFFYPSILCDFFFPPPFPFSLPFRSHLALVLSHVIAFLSSPFFWTPVLLCWSHSCIS